MQAIAIDTLALAREFQASGFTVKQSQGAAEAISRHIGQSIVTNDSLKQALAEQEARIVKWVAALLVGQVGILAGLVFALMKI